MLGNELNLSLEDSANIVDVIGKVDEIVLEKGRFPIVGCKSLLHLTYHPFEKRFYRHVALMPIPGQKDSLTYVVIQS